MPTNAAEMAELKREFDALRSRVNQLEAQRQGILDGLAEATGMSRRQILAIATTMGGAGALATYGTTEAQGAAQPSGGEGDVGSTTSPFEGFADGLAMVTESVSSATTVTKPVVLFDSSVSGFTLTISSDLEGPSGFSQTVTFIDVGGAAASNNVTVNASGGGTVATIDSSEPMVVRWDGSNWTAGRFIPTANVGSLSITDRMGVMEKTSDQTIAASGGLVQVTWDSEDDDAAGFADPTNDQFVAALAGDYQLTAFFRFSGLSAGDNITGRVFVNNTGDRYFTNFDADGAVEGRQFSISLKGLSQNDTVDLRFDASADTDIQGSVITCWGAFERMG